MIRIYGGNLNIEVAWMDMFEGGNYHFVVI